MLEPRNPNQIPPGGWRWVHPETGKRVSGKTWDGLRIAARMFLGNNGFPIPLDLDDHILEWMNKEIQENAARHGFPPEQFLSESQGPSLLTRAFTFAHAAKEWVKAGMPITDHEGVEWRVGICKTCPYWKGETSPFHVMCGKCGCSGLKLFLATSRCPDGRW